MGKKLKSKALHKVRKTSEQLRKDKVKRSKSKAQPRRANHRQMPEEEEDGKRVKTSPAEEEDENSAEEMPDNYGSQEYWDARHADSKDFDSKFEWFLSYHEVKPILEASGVDFKDKQALFIDLGCGTSHFLMDLKKDGYLGKCLGLDYSAEAIARMNACEPHQVEYRVSDATVFLEPNSTVILDKSLMDTMLHQMGEEGELAVESMLNQVYKSLADRSTFILITQLDPNSAKDVEFFTQTVVKNLTNAGEEGSKYLSQVVVHVTSGNGQEDEEDGALPVPNVFVFQFAPSTSKPKDFVLEMEIVEYEAGGGKESESESE